MFNVIAKNIKNVRANANNNTKTANINSSNNAGVKVSTKWMLLLFEHLRDAQAAGLSIERMTARVAETFPNKKIRALFKQIHVRVLGGEDLSEAMRRFPNSFPSYVIELIKACEESGKWNTVKKPNGEVEVGILDLLINLLKRSDRTRRKLVSGMIYPAIIAVFVIAAIGAFSFMVLPTIKEVFISLGVYKSLSFISIALFDLGDWVQTNYQFVPFVLLAFAGLGKLFWDYYGKKLWQRYQLRIKVIDKVFINAHLAESFLLLGILLDAGITVVDGLRIVANASKNTEVTGAFELAAAYSEREGLILTDALKKSHFIFNEEILYRISTGWETGKLPETLIAFSNQMFEKLDEEIDRFLGLIEPAMIASAGVAVAFLAISFYGSLSSAIANIR